MKSTKKFDALFLDFQKVTKDPKFFIPEYSRLQQFLGIYNSFFEVLFSDYCEKIKSEKLLDKETFLKFTPISGKTEFHLKNSEIVDKLTQVWRVTRKENSIINDLSDSPAVGNSNFPSLGEFLLDSIQRASPDLFLEENWNKEFAKISEFVNQRVLFVFQLKKQRDFLVEILLKCKKAYIPQYYLLLGLLTLDETIILLLIDCQGGLELFDLLEDQKSLEAVMKPIRKSQQDLRTFLEDGQFSQYFNAFFDKIKKNE